MVGQESLLKEARRIVVKVGSALVTNDGRGLDVRAIERWAGQIAALRAMGREVLLWRYCRGRASYRLGNSTDSRL